MQRKGKTKHCCWGLSKSDSRDPEKFPDNGYAGVICPNINPMMLCTHVRDVNYAAFYC